MKGKLMGIWKWLKDLMMVRMLDELICWKGQFERCGKHFINLTRNETFKNPFFMTIPNHRRYKQTIYHRPYSKRSQELHSSFMEPIGLGFWIWFVMDIWTKILTSKTLSPFHLINHTKNLDENTDTGHQKLDQS